MVFTRLSFGWKYIAYAFSFLVLSIANAHAQDFADDFTFDAVNAGYQVNIDHIANVDTVAVVQEAGLHISIEHSDPLGGQRAIYELWNNDIVTEVSAVAAFIGERPTEGNLRFEVYGEFANAVADGGAVEGEDLDNIQVEISLLMGATPEEDSAQFCFGIRDAEGYLQPINGIGSRCNSFSISGLELEKIYSLTIGIDHGNQELYAQMNDELQILESPYPFYSPSNGSHFARFRVRDGAERGEFMLTSAAFNGDALPLEIINDLGRYKTSDYSGDDSRSKEVVGERLRLSTSVDSSEGSNDSTLLFGEASRYIEADLMFSSESSVDTTNGGFGAIRVAGIQYNDLSDDNDADSLGSVWGAVLLIDIGDPTLVAEYCLLRSDTGDFSETTDLIDGLDDGKCLRFDMPVEQDKVYNASVALDVDAKTVTFTLDDETKIYNIETDMYFRDDTLLVQVRMTGGAAGTVVGYVDNLRNNPSALTDDELISALANDDSSDSDGGGGGCSIVQGQKEYSILLLLLSSLIVLGFKALRRF